LTRWRGGPRVGCVAEVLEVSIQGWQQHTHHPDCATWVYVRPPAKNSAGQSRAQLGATPWFSRRPAAGHLPSAECCAGRDVDNRRSMSNIIHMGIDLTHSGRGCEGRTPKCSIFQSTRPIDLGSSATGDLAPMTDSD
jgi:hypothetical protein